MFRALMGNIKDALKVNMLAGMLFLTPIAATFFFFRLMINWVDMILLVLPEPYRPENFLPFPIPGLGLILVLMITFLAGFFVRNYVGRQLVLLWEWIMERIPFVSKVYKAVKQLVETIFSSSRDFKRVVLIEYPRKGVYTLAFVTGTATGEIQAKTSRRVVNLFVPTTPNPTSGFYLMVPEEDLIPLDMSVEDSFKVLMSGGILTPVHKPAKCDSPEAAAAPETSKANQSDGNPTPPNS